MRCWTCNHIGHVAANFHTMRCYNCSGFGHKAQTCTSPRRQPMKSPSYKSTRRTNESLKKNYAGGFDTQRTSGHNQGHSQVWKKNNVLLDMNEFNLCKEGGGHMESQNWGLSNTLMNLDFMEFGGWTHRKLVVTPSTVTGPRIMITAGKVIGGEKTFSCDLMNSL